MAFIRDGINKQHTYKQLDNNANIQNCLRFILSRTQILLKFAVQTFWCECNLSMSVIYNLAEDFQQCNFELWCLSYAFEGGKPSPLSSHQVTEGKRQSSWFDKSPLTELTHNMKVWSIAHNFPLHKWFFSVKEFMNLPRRQTPSPLLQFTMNGQAKSSKVLALQ